MRASVVLSDLLVYMPGAFTAVYGFAARQETAVARVVAVLAFWWMPPLLLVDHGHFQYNGVCFGLCLAAAGCVARGRILLASLLFTSGLLFKQIALYYAPAFFFGILAPCVHQSTSAIAAVGRVAVTGSVVIGTTVLIFLPWISAPSPLAAMGQVIHRMFPFARGLYEDKVANVWCSISVIVKLHRLLPQERIPAFCALTTLAGFLPACLCCLRPRQNGKVSFVAALVASSLSFFLFGFQVHEKSILFPCVAVFLLPVAVGPDQRPRWTVAALCHLLLVCLFSIYPLVVKDGLQVAYILLCVLLVVMCEAAPAPPALRAGFRGSFLLAFLVHGVHAAVPAPRRYPDLWTLLITGSSCAYFVFCLCLLTLAQVGGAFERTMPGKDE